MNNAEYWKNKLERNDITDRMKKQQLTQMGWKVITLWECELKKDFIGVLETVVKKLKKNA